MTIELHSTHRKMVKHRFLSVLIMTVVVQSTCKGRKIL